LFFEVILLTLCQRIGTTPNVEVILLTAHGNIPDGVQAIKNGAFDYITKGDDNNKIIPLISRAVEKAKMNVRLEKLEKKVGQMYSFDSILGESKALKEAVLLAQKVSVTDVPVLLTGETGTGKEVFAQAIHYSSKRSKQNFVAVNCSSFSKELLESEMFGHRAGSFTGALKDKKGLFEEANNGTIFLDEIGDLDLSCQVKLLRVLQDQTFEVLGDSRPRKVDVRVVSATNADLRKMVAERTFREDLFYRINLITVKLPALRERREDIPLLARHFADRQAAVNGLPRTEFSADALNFLSRLPYSGNIRELKNLVERTILVSGKQTLDASDFESQYQRHDEPAKAADGTSFAGMTLDEIERQTILQALEQHKGNLSQVALALGISRAALYRRLEKYKIAISD
jgi:two-component system NtrC family response regulator